MIVICIVLSSYARLWTTGWAKCWTDLHHTWNAVFP